MYIIEDVQMRPNPCRLQKVIWLFVIGSNLALFEHLQSVFCINYWLYNIYLPNVFVALTWNTLQFPRTIPITRKTTPISPGSVKIFLICIWSVDSISTSSNCLKSYEYLKHLWNENSKKSLYCRTICKG